MDAAPSIPDFELIRRIGGGSYGDVWLGRSVTGVYRAVKIVNRSRFQDSRPFLREFEGIRRFQNAVGSQPRQLALLHVGCDEEAGVLYYIMELADDAEAGTDIDPATYVPLTLKELRRRRAELLPISECVAIGASLANALTGLHETGLIHRDVKPSNIIFVGGVPKLADVGLVASSEQTLTSLGTPGYAPPEGGGNAQGDLYSLGKILYELATGLGPEEFPRVPRSLLSTKNAEQLLELNEVILRACDPLPAQRYPNAQALLDDLRLLQAGRSVQELNRNRRRLRWLTRFALIGGMIAVGIILVLGVKNYLSLQRLAAKEGALRQLAEAHDRAARYTSDLHLAQQGFAAGDFGATRIALRRQIPPSSEQPDLRGIEWYALWNETAGEQTAIGGTIGGPAVSAVALSPDGKFLAAQEGGRPRETVVWDLMTGRRTSIAKDTLGLGGFSADGSRLIVGTADKHVFEYELQTNLRRPNQAVVGRLFQQLADGHTLLLSEQGAMDSRLIVWDTETQQQIADWRPAPRPYKVNLSAAAISQDHRLLAASFFGGDGALRSRDLAVYNLGEKTESFRLTDIERVQCLRFSPDGRLLAIVMWNQPTRIVSSITGETVHQLLDHKSLVHAVEFSPDSRTLASIGGDRSISLWDVESGVKQRDLLGHEADTLSLAWFPEGTRLVTGGRDGTWRSWSSAIKPVGHMVEKLWADILGDFVFSPDGRSIVATNGAGQIAVLDSHSLELIGTIESAFQPLLFENNGRSLLSLTKDNTLIRYDFLHHLSEAIPLALKNEEKLTSVEVSTTHHLAAFGFSQGSVEVWNLEQKKSLGSSKDQAHQIGAFAWAADRPELSVGNSIGQLRSKIFRGSPVTTTRGSEHRSSIYSLAYSPDGKWLAVGKQDGRVSIESRETGVVEQQLEGHSASVSALAFSPDGSRLVTGGLDGMIIFWSVASHRQIAVWSWNDNVPATTKSAIYRLKFDPLGNRIAVMTEDGKLRLWDATR